MSIKRYGARPATLAAVLSSLGVAAILAQPCQPEWSALGAGLNIPVEALLSLPDGDLVAGGYAVNPPLHSIARWNAKTEEWSWLESGMTGAELNPVTYAFATLPNGDLIAGGHFATVDGVTVNHIARWDGTGGGAGNWHSLGSGMSGGSPSGSTVRALATLSNGDLVAGGNFFYASGVPAYFIARWNGTNWFSLGSPEMYDAVYSLKALPNGDLIAGGFFSFINGTPASGIARWNGTKWFSLGTGIQGAVLALTSLPNGDLIAGGDIAVAGGVVVSNIARWNGTAWSGVGSGVYGGSGTSRIEALTTLENGDVIAGGFFLIAGGVPASRIARWNGTKWSGLGSGMSGPVWALTTMVGGDLVAGGFFGSPAGAIARYGCPKSACESDCDESGTLTIDDFICFQTKYAIGAPEADCDKSGGLDIDDFICFQTLYAIGC